MNAAEIGEDRVVLRDVSWSTYESLLDDLADTSSPRLAYDEGTLGIMTPLGRHEALNRTLAMLVGAMAEELGIDIQDFGSTTVRREPLHKGFEPDSCFSCSTSRPFEARSVWTSKAIRHPTSRSRSS